MLSNFYKITFVATLAFIAVSTTGLNINQKSNFDFGVKQVFADDGGGRGVGSGGTGGCCGGGSNPSGNGGSGGGPDRASQGNYYSYSCSNGATNYPSCNNNYVPPTCPNGYTNYPTCAPTTCTNGATNFPSCNNNVCTNGATNYPSCNNVCTNGYTNYPTCAPTTCTNGATNFPSCNNNVCTNGATNYPYCNNNTCSNGYTNYPTCAPTTCTNGATNFPSCNNNYCSNGATNFPYCNNNQQYCSNGATNYPYCNNNYIPPTITYVWCNGVQYQAPHACYQPVNYSVVATKMATAVGYTYGQLNGAYIEQGTNNSQCVSFFDYGPNGSLGSRTQGQNLYTNYTTNYFSQAVYGLYPNTIYSYRAGVTCLDGTKYGNVYQFRTPGYVKVTTYRKPIVYSKPKTVVSKAPTCNCEAITYMTISAQNLENEASIGKYANYRIIFKNTSSSALENVVVKVVLPEELSVYSSEQGQFTKGGKTVIFALPLLQAGETGNFVVTATVASSLALGRQVLVNAYANYTVVNTLKNGLPLKGEVTGYVVTLTGNSGGVIDNGNNSGSTNSNWYPNNLFDWALLIAVVAIFLAAIRYLFTAFKTSGTRAQ